MPRTLSCQSASLGNSLCRHWHVFGNQHYKPFCLCYDKSLIFNAEKILFSISTAIYSNLSFGFSLLLRVLSTSIPCPSLQLAHIIFSKIKSSIPSHCSQRQRSLTLPVRSCLVLAIWLSHQAPYTSLPLQANTSLPSVPSTQLFPLVFKFCTCCILWWLLPPLFHLINSYSCFDLSSFFWERLLWLFWLS